MSKYLSSLLGSKNIKTILETKVSDIKRVSGIDILHLPLGTILMYHGTGIATPTTKNNEISVANGDSFDMLGWHVCNGLGGSTDLSSKFLRMEMTAGNTGGDDSAPYISHSHTLVSGGAHAHSTGIESSRHRHTYCNYWSTGFGGLDTGGSYGCTQGTTTGNSHSHSLNAGGAHSDHSIGYSGTSSTSGKNVPPCKALIFVERKTLQPYKLPLGTILLYHGSAISDIEGKYKDLSLELGMQGWYVANGQKSGTLNLINYFARNDLTVSTGTSQGYQDVTLPYHNHTTQNSSTHGHTTDTKTHTHGFPGSIYSAYFYGAGGIKPRSWVSANWYEDDIALSSVGAHTHETNNSTSHAHTISTVGDDDGVDKNSPAYKTLIFIQKVEA